MITCLMGMCHVCAYGASNSQPSEIEYGLLRPEWMNWRYAEETSEDIVEWFLSYLAASVQLRRMKVSRQESINLEQREMVHSWDPPSRGCHDILSH